MKVGSTSAAVAGCLDVLPDSQIELDPATFGSVPSGTPVRVLAAGRVAVGGETVPAGKRLPLAAAGALTQRYAIRFFAGEDGVYATVRPLGLALSFK